MIAAAAAPGFSARSKPIASASAISSALRRGAEASAGMSPTMVTGGADAQAVAVGAIIARDEIVVNILYIMIAYRAVPAWIVSSDPTATDSPAIANPRPGSFRTSTISPSTIAGTATRTPTTGTSPQRPSTSAVRAFPPAG